MDEQDFPPPAHLSAESQKLWREIVPSRARSIGRQVLVTQALEALDRANQARMELAGKPLTTTTATTKAVHVHPAVKVEREYRAQFARLWSDLALTWTQSVDGMR